MWIPDPGGVLVLLKRLRLRSRDFCKKEKLLLGQGGGNLGRNLRKQLLVELLIPECPLDEREAAVRHGLNQAEPLLITKPTWSTLLTLHCCYKKSSQGV